MYSTLRNCCYRYYLRFSLNSQCTSISKKPSWKTSVNPTTMDARVDAEDTQVDSLDQRVLWTITSMHCKILFVHIILYMSEQEQTLPAKEH